MSQAPKRGKWDSSDDESDTGKRAPKQMKKSVSKSALKAEEIQVVPPIVEVAPQVESVEVEEVTIIVSDVEMTSAADVSKSVQEEVQEEPAAIESAPVAEPKAEVPAVRVHNSIFDGCRSVDCYQRINFIDQGTYGMVFKAKCRETGEIFALKQIKFGPETSKVGFPITALREINILLALQHPNIVRVKEMVVGSSIDKIYMVMEYCENDLKKCMQMSKQSFSTAEVSIAFFCFIAGVFGLSATSYRANLECRVLNRGPSAVPLPQVKQLMVQLLQGVDHMHQKWYIHRDLKTSNLLYSNKGFLAVCDFGLARKYGRYGYAFDN